MYGFPTRKQSPSRPLPVGQTRFDPSGDVRCTGWWRADKGVTRDDGYVTSWANQLPPFQQFTTGAPYRMVSMPRATNGFPAMIVSGGVSNYSVNQLAQDGDTECSLTYVVRFPAYGNTESGGTHIELDGQALQIGIWATWPRPYISGGWRTWMDNGTETCTGLTSVAVITARVSVATPTDGWRYYTFNINSRAKRGPFGMSGEMAMTPSSSLTIRGESRRVAYLHEVVYFRGALPDDDVNAMHTLLQQQYIAV